jgi:hypothetical protein
MRHRSKLLLTGLMAALLLSMAVSSASANRISLSAQDFDARWMEINPSSLTCPITLQGSFHSRTIAKVPSALIGFVSRSSFSGCNGGTATVLTATLPWHITYRSFRGTLPSITGVNINIIGLSWQIQPSGGITCLARTTTATPLISIFNISGGRATSLTADEVSEIPLTGSGGFCPFSGGVLHVAGTTSSLTRLASTASITVTLI